MRSTDFFSSVPNCGLLHTAWHTSSSSCSVQQANIASTSCLHDGKKAGLFSSKSSQTTSKFWKLPNFTQVTGAQFTETAEHSHGENYQVVKCRVPIYSVIGSCKVLTCNKKFLFKVWEKEKKWRLHWNSESGYCISVTNLYISSFDGIPTLTRNVAEETFGPLPVHSHTCPIQPPQHIAKVPATFSKKCHSGSIKTDFKKFLLPNFSFQIRFTDVFTHTVTHAYFFFAQQKF